MQNPHLKISITLIAMLICLSAWQSAFADWKMHPCFSGDVSRIIETRNFVYFTSKTLPRSNSLVASYSLFRYDKQTDEIISVSTDNMIGCNRVDHIEYNSSKGYVVTVGSNHDIDFIYDNGRNINLPAYRLASVSYPKTVYSVNIDRTRDRIFLATEFGYITINDERHEVAESHIFGQRLKGAAQLAEYIIVLNGEEIMYAPVAKKPRSLADFNSAGIFPGAEKLTTEDNSLVNLIFSDGNGFSAMEIVIENGIPAIITDTSKPIPGNDTYPVGNLIPNAPAPFISAEMRYNENHGMMTMDFGFQHGFLNIDTGAPFLLSSLSDGMWRNLSPGFTDPSQGNAVSRPSGFAVDPDNPDYVYVATVGKGFARYNVNDASDIIHFSRPSDPGKDLPGFVNLVSDQTGDNSWCCRFSAPRFDPDGNMWLSYTDFDNQTPPRVHLFCWETADRRNTTMGTIFPPKLLEVPGVRPSNTDLILPLWHNSTPGRLLYCNGIYDFAFMVIDTNGTPTDGNDDRVTVITTLTDKDGNNISAHNVRFMWEDPDTGFVWVGHEDGIFYFNPDDFSRGDGLVSRVKVARHDGTNLADWLLNDVTVNGITTDGNGRKWFATNGAGIVILSEDGVTVDDELNTNNSRLPSDVVYSLCHNPQSNSILISTQEGLTEYTLPFSQASGTPNQVRAYPNPVRPDYAGYVTIDGLPREALVKITDASGNLVKELRTEGSVEVNWDVTGLDFRRVASGVYFILASDRDAESSFANVGKILVVN